MDVSQKPMINSFKRRLTSGLCPRDPAQFIEKMEDPSFRKHQKRRAQTEARIGIFKNSILDGSLYERNIENKQMKVAKRFWRTIFGVLPGYPN